MSHPDDLLEHLEHAAAWLHASVAALEDGRLPPRMLDEALGFAQLADPAWHERLARVVTQLRDGREGFGGCSKRRSTGRRTRDARDLPWFRPTVDGG